MGLPALGVVAGEVIGALFDVFEARTEHAAQAVGEDDLVLQVQCLALHLFEDVGAGARAVGFGLAIDRFIDVDGVVAAGDRRHAFFFFAVILVFAADQQFMLPTADVEQAAQFELGNAVMPTGGAFAIAAVDGVAVGIQRAAFRGVAPQAALFVVAGEAHLPGVVEVVFHGGLEAVVVVADVAVVGLAEEGRAGHAMGRNDATVEG